MELKRMKILTGSNITIMLLVSGVTIQNITSLTKVKFLRQLSKKKTHIVKYFYSTKMSINRI